MTDREMDELDALLTAARTRHVEAGGDLMARVLTDAASVQSQITAPRAPVSIPVRLSRALQELLGGWRPLGGVMAMGLAGLWIGIALPSSVEGLAARMIGTTQAVTFLPEADLSFLEEPSDG